MYTHPTGRGHARQMIRRIAIVTDQLHRRPHSRQRLPEIRMIDEIRQVHRQLVHADRADNLHTVLRRAGVQSFLTGYEDADTRLLVTRIRGRE